MPAEVGVTGIHDLDAEQPPGSETADEAHLYLQNIKGALKGTFSDLGTNGGVVNATAVQLNRVVGVTSLIQDQLDAKQEQLLRHVTAATYTLGSEAYIHHAFTPPTGGVTVTLPASPTLGGDKSHYTVRDSGPGSSSPDNIITVQVDGGTSHIMREAGTNTGSATSLTLTDGQIIEFLYTAANFWRYWVR